MNIRFAIERVLGIGFTVLALVGCGGGDTVAPPPAVGSATLGAAGGTVDGPDGVRLEVPAGSLASEVTFRIARDASGAPALEGIHALSPVYAASPHGQTFGATALMSIPLSAAQIPAGATPILLKAEPGGRWRIMRNSSVDAARLAADVGELSYFVIAACSSSNTAWVIGFDGCPSNHELRLTMFDGLNQPVQILRGPNGVQLPLWYVTDTVQSRTFTLSWTRPAGTNRTDTVGIAGSPGGVTMSLNPREQGVNGNLSRSFTVTIDPSQVSGASSPNGAMFRVRGYAVYNTIAFQVGVGNVPVGFSFDTEIPILIRFSGTQPLITQQPAGAVSVVENTGFSLTGGASGSNISYQWRYYQNVSDTAVRPAEGINDQAVYTSPLAPLGFNGRLYYLHICSHRGVPGLERCLTTQATTLTVTQFTQFVAFAAQPVSRSIIEGEGVNFSAAVTGAPTPILQWHYAVSCSIRPLLGRVCSGTPMNNGAGVGALAGATIGGASSATLNLVGVPLAANGTTLALLATQPSLGQSLFSDLVTLGVNARAVAPMLTSPLTSQTITAGGTATFTIGLSGTELITTDWVLSGQPVMASGMFIHASTPCRATVNLVNNRSIVLSAVTEACSGLTVQAQARNVAGGPATSSATLTVIAAPSAPTISQPPAASTVNEDTRATVQVGYGGSGPVTLVLQRFLAGNWIDVASTNSTVCASPCAILTPALSLADNGAMFRVRLINAQGSVDSVAVTITVAITRAANFTGQPAAATVDANLATAAGTANFDFAVANDSGAFTWQWLLNGQPLADGSGVTGNGVLQTASVSGSSGTLSTAAAGRLTLSNVPLMANGAQISVRITRTIGSQSRAASSTAAGLTVSTGVAVNALTATQIVAGTEWSMVLRPDRTVWAWGSKHRNDGTVQGANLSAADQAHRPIRMYPAALIDVRAISGWSNSFWALKGEPGSAGSRVLHWGQADAGADGRGGDRNGSIGNSIPTRHNEAAPVEVLERVNNLPRPVDRVCAIAGGGEQLAMIRAIDSAGITTDCNAGSPKTVWFVGALTARGYDSTGIAFAMPGLPSASPPALIFTGQTTSGSPGLVIALEDGRLYALGNTLHGGFGVAATGSGTVGGLGGPLLLPASWGHARSFGMSFYYALFVVRTDGSVMTSGFDGWGELGLGSAGQGRVNAGPLPLLAETCTAEPCAQFLTGVSAIASTSGPGATLALKNGRVLGWGNNNTGLLGPGPSVDQPIPRALLFTTSGLSALSASYRHALAIGPGNVVYAWGSGLRGALGNGPSGENQVTPTMVTTP